jgi:hypothetical protein
MASKFKSKLLESLLQLKLVLYLCSFLEFLMDAKNHNSSPTDNGPCAKYRVYICAKAVGQLPLNLKFELVLLLLQGAR